MTGGLREQRTSVLPRAPAVPPDSAAGENSAAVAAVAVGSGGRDNTGYLRQPATVWVAEKQEDSAAASDWQLSVSAESLVLLARAADCGDTVEDWWRTMRSAAAAGREDWSDALELEHTAADAAAVDRK